MKKIKKIIVAGLIGVLAFSLCACGSQEVAENVIATVNGQAIKQTDYDELFNEYLEYFGGGDEAKEYLESQKSILLEELITNEVLFQKADELGITCSEEEVKEAYAEIVSSYGEETVNQMLEYAGMTEETYKAMLKEQLILAKLQEVMIKGDTTVTEKEAKAYYEEHIDAYTQGAGANIEHILVRLPENANEEQVKKAEAAVAEIEKELASGESFEALAKKYSSDKADDDLYVVEDLGFVTYDEPNFDKDFLAGAKALGEGEVSGPIKTSFGYHFIKVNGISEEKVLPFSEVKEDVMATLKDEKQYSLYEACLNKWMDEAQIVKYEDHIQ